ncbi:molybdopterin-containing oxidoreductase family protein [Turicimonas muris]|uniref:molybdopterin-containing oxidoreductase family protein n=1 Tax=Turicimonas muris TaxID=1796652 RepID=UPI0024959209|nr:molybdopterin-dependent oxidoreductase [Turicimonas muris]
MELSKLTRRSFNKAAAFSSAAISLGALSSGLKKAKAAPVQIKNAEQDETKIIKTNCRACIFNCGVLAHVRNGRVVKLEGNPEYPMTKGSMCAKGLSGLNALYHPNRNKYPMIRVGERGENKWKRISWEEAIDTIAKKLMETREKYGAESVFCSTGGGGNPAFRSIARFCNIFGTPNWYEPGCAQCYLPRTLAYGIMYGGPSTSIADESALEIYVPNTPMKSFVCWGTDPSYSCPAGGGRALAELRARGVKSVSIDPRFTPDAAKADVWLPIRPGTDVALMLAWINYIIEHKMYDQDFVMHWTNLPYLVNTKTKMFLRPNEIVEGGNPKDYVVWDTKSGSPKVMPYPWDDNLSPALEGTFEYKGQQYKTGFTMLKEQAAPYTIEKAAEICWLVPEKIVEAIKIFADGPSGIALGVATDQFPNSVEAAMGSVILNGLMGYVEKPGTMLQRFPSGGTAPAGSLAPRAQHCLPHEQLLKRLGGTQFKGLLQWDAASPTAILNAILTEKPYPLKVWLERSGNKFNVLGNASSWEPAIKKLDFVVHMYMYPTSFSTYADMLLPTTEWLETNMLIDCMNYVFARQAVTHTYETVDETLIWSWILRRCAELGHEGCQKALDPEFMGAELPLWKTMEELLDAKLKRHNVTWKEVKEGKNPIQYMPMENWAQYYVYKKINPKTNLPLGFHTPSKKMELYGEVFINLGRTGMPYVKKPLPAASKDYSPLPFYMEPSESPNREIAKKYPLVMTNGRLPMYHHGTLRNNPISREIYPLPEIWVNPADAKKYGVAQGDWTWVENDRGKIRAKCRVTEGIPEGIVYQERFWNPETLNTPTRGWKEMNVNVLTKNTPPFNDVVGTYTLRGFQVKISKADKGPDGVWSKPEDFKVWMPSNNVSETSVPTYPEHGSKK